MTRSEVLFTEALKEMNSRLLNTLDGLKVVITEQSKVMERVFNLLATASPVQRDPMTQSAIVAQTEVLEKLVTVLEEYKQDSKPHVEEKKKSVLASSFRNMIENVRGRGNGL